MLAALGLAAVLVGCGDGGSDDEGAPPGTGDRPGTTEAPPGAPEPPPAPEPGTGVVVVGGTSSSFDLTECRLAPHPSEPAGAQTLVSLSGSGTTARGVEFTVEVQRFATGTDVRTFTDTATYTDTARILQAQRVEVAGGVTDLRDPDASSALLRVRPDGVSLSGLASGPGDDAEEGGLVGLALNATCG